MMLTKRIKLKNLKKGQIFSFGSFEYEFKYKFLSEIFGNYHYRRLKTKKGYYSSNADSNVTVKK
jgi:hypothetical protein